MQISRFGTKFLQIDGSAYPSNTPLSSNVVTDVCALQGQKAMNECWKIEKKNPSRTDNNVSTLKINLSQKLAKMASFQARMTLNYLLLCSYRTCTWS